MRKGLLPCESGEKTCIYEYGGASDRDVEGMPFPKSKIDKRACPKYGHICPHFMEDFNLTVESLNIRSTIHCGTLAKQMIENGHWKLSEMAKDQSEQIDNLLKRLDDRINKYPPEEFPQYYNF